MRTHVYPLQIPQNTATVFLNLISFFFFTYRVSPTELEAWSYA